jgi:MinD-like ATPase involved in chromosome partitioning or flagellar assembly
MDAGEPSPLNGHGRAPGAWSRRESDRGDPDVWAIAGGKGGVGKSVVAANLAVSVVRRGLTCLLIDADLGGGNQHTLFGVEAPRVTLDAFLSGDERELTAVAARTRYPGLSLIFARCDALGSANPKHAQKQRLLRHIAKAAVDVVILDLGAGTTLNTLDLFLSARVQLVVTTPELTAIQNAYGFIKCASQRAQAQALPCAPRLLANVSDEEAAARVVRALRSVTTSFLGAEASEAGFVRKDPGMPTSVERGTPVVALSPTSVAARDLDGIAQRLLDECFMPPTGVALAVDTMLARGLNEELRLGGRVYHVQTEDLGVDKRQIRTQVFERGRVVFSKVLEHGVKTPDGRVLSRQQQVEYQHRVVLRAIQDNRLA